MIIARSALLLSDTKEAVLYLDKEKNLSVYADMRGRKADEVREQVLMDFGLDAAAERSMTWRENHPGSLLRRI